ncbi:DNA-binding response regulator [Leptospira kobayashii]|uniref:DNA-binding response regulator n=1 Tax=Leptospira kobayashii TaxID=1917830 RepID=A0ABN6K9M2_9LEPT|nr:LytTR family DNA-binding domain-containing protein [Leptospira kobayashii]BDA77513.1 DNA-binding response regulator [Leptospira kobayashii]
MGEELSYSVLIIEDEYPARMLMMDYVLGCPELKLAGIAEDGDKAFKLLEEKEFDLVFLDINLPAKSGIEILKSVRKPKTFFILTTAYSEYAVEAFDLEALDYLLKPFSFLRFRKSVDKALKYWKETPSAKEDSDSNDHLTFTSESATHLLSYNEIHFISANNKSSVIHTNAKDYETPKLLKDLEEKLPSKLFIRIHKGYLVNIKYITNLRYDKGGAYLVQLKNEDETVLPVGRSFAGQLKETLGL